jgi:hypothetical protein
MECTVVKKLIKKMFEINCGFVLINNVIEISWNHKYRLVILEDMYFFAHLECSSLNIIQGKKYFKAAQNKMKHVLFAMFQFSFSLNSDNRHFTWRHICTFCMHLDWNKGNLEHKLEIACPFWLNFLIQKTEVVGFTSTKLQGVTCQMMEIF